MDLENLTFAKRLGKIFIYTFWVRKECVLSHV